MINNFPFFRGPFYRYPRYYSSNRTHLPYNNVELTPPSDFRSNSFNNSKNFTNNQIRLANSVTSNTENLTDKETSSDRKKRNSFDNKKINSTYQKENFSDNKRINSTYQKEKSSKYFPLGPILINTDGFFDKNEPIINLSGLRIYLDDIIIVSLIYILYKENVKDDVLFISLLLLLIS